MSVQQSYSLTNPGSIASHDAKEITLFWVLSRPGPRSSTSRLLSVNYWLSEIFRPIMAIISSEPKSARQAIPGKRLWAAILQSIYRTRITRIKVYLVMSRQWWWGDWREAFAILILFPAALIFSTFLSFSFWRHWYFHSIALFLHKKPQPATDLLI